MNPRLRIILCAVDDALADAWRGHCGDLDNVEVYRGSILDLSVSAVVSPANSYGFMDGGIDALYSQHWPNVEYRVKIAAARQPIGELLVGQAELVFTDDLKIPHLIAAPTMRVPMILPRDTVNPYLAARAAIALANKRKLASIAFPGLGTGVGKVSPEICAHQMRQAIDDDDALANQPDSWWDAQKRHQSLYGNSTHDLQSGRIKT